MSTELDRYGGAEAYAAYDRDRSEARERELRYGTCGACAHAFTCEAGGCVCLADPLDPYEVDPRSTAREMGCEGWEAA